jgi:membrane protease YdiL (CAAX protease family)
MNSELSSALLRVLPFVLALLFIGLAMKKGRVSRGKIGLVRPSSLSRFFLWCLFFTVYAVVIELFLARAQLLVIDKWNHPFVPSVIRILGAVVFAPVAEELIFRGVFQSMLAERMSIHAAIVIQALVFVLLHSFTYENTVVSNIGVAQTMTDGVLYGYARRHTGSLYTPMAMHMIGNLIATLERFIV